jgi:hypothetical protein
MNRCLTLLAATLTLTAAACGDNLSEPVEVDDDSADAFDRFTVDVDSGYMSADYLAPNSIFAYANQSETARTQWAEDIGAVNVPGYAVGGYEVNEISGPLDGNAVGGYQIGGANFNIELTAAETAPACNTFSELPVAPAYSDVGFDNNELAPEALDAPQGAEARVPTAELYDDRMACRDGLEGDTDEMAGVCECADLDCVAGYVDAVMGCDVCMTFVCGDDLLGACSACTP